MHRSRSTPAEARYVLSLQNAYAKGWAAAKFPSAANPYKNFEQRKSWFDGLQAACKDQPKIELPKLKLGKPQMKVWKNGANFILEVPAAKKTLIAELMAYRGLAFSVSASNRERAILFSSNPYALADLAGDDCPELAPYKAAIDKSRALDGKGTRRLPPGRELWDYQRGTLDYLLERGGGINGDQPGLGKTPTAICFCNEVEAMRVLCIVPASVRIQWGERIREWSTIPNVKAIVMLKTKDGIHPTAHYQVISYDAARNPAIIKAISKYKWDVLICDEAHKMKDQDAITTRAILGNSRGEFQHGEEKMPAIASYCGKRLALTGTLLRNRPSESYVLLRHFDHEAIDFLSWDKFKEKYNKQADIKTISGKRHKLESTSLELELQNRLRVNVMVRHEKKDLGYRPPIYGLVKVQETGAVKAALEAEGLLDISIEEIQTTSDFKILGHIAEVRRLMGIAMAPQIIDYAIDFLEGSEQKLTIFGWHLEVLSLFEEALSRFGTERIDGSKSSVQRNRSVDNFVKDVKKRVIVGNMQAMGEGIDGLQLVCSHCFIAEPEWVPANVEQAVSRLDRIGQKELVNAEIFIAPGSISEKIFVKALDKLNVIHRVMDMKEG